MGKKLTVKEIVCGGLFTALVAAGAFIQVPIPGMDYFTLQFLFVLLAGILLFLYVCFQKKKGLSAFSLKLGKWCLGFGLLSLYASSAYFPWEKIQSISLLNRIVEKIQFPFR